jgi:hypothetical protein
MRDGAGDGGDVGLQTKQKDVVSGAEQAKCSQRVPDCGFSGWPQTRSRSSPGIQPRLIEHTPDKLMISICFARKQASAAPHRGQYRWPPGRICRGRCCRAAASLKCGPFAWRAQRADESCASSHLGVDNSVRPSYINSHKRRRTSEWPCWAWPCWA